MPRTPSRAARPFRPAVEPLETRVVPHHPFGPNPPNDLGALIEVQTSAGFRPLDGALVPTMTPEVRVTLPPGPPRPNLRVLLDDHDPGTPAQDVTAAFPGLGSAGTATATLDVGLGGHTVEVRHGPRRGAAAMLNFAADSLVVTSPVANTFARDRDTDLRHERDVLLLNFRDDAPFDAVSDFLCRESLVPLDVALPLRLVRVEIPRQESPFVLGERLTEEGHPYLEGALPNLLLTTDADVDVEAERLPDRLRNTYQAADGGFDDTGGDATNELRVFRYHFFMDTFAGHRLVQTLVGANPAEQAAVAVIDTGLGRGGANPNTTDIAIADILRPSGVTARHAALHFNAAGDQVDARNMAANTTLAEIADLGDNNGHGTPVTMAAAGRGTLTLGTGRDVRVRPFRPALVVGPDGRNGPTAASAAYCLVAAARDNDVFVVNTSFGASGNDARDPWVAAQIEGAARNLATDLRVAGKIWVTSAGNDGDNTTAANADRHYPSDLAPGPQARAAADPLVMSVSASGTMDDIEGPERLRSGSNFGDRVSVAAPGDDVILPRRNGTLSAIDGTSFASPFVAGLAGEMIFLDRNLRAAGARLTPLQIIELIEASADDLGSSVAANDTGKPNDRPGNGRDVAFGHGRVNAWKALLGVANGGVAATKLDANNRNEVPSLAVIPEAQTTWYGFKVRTSVLGATAWIDGNPLTDPNAPVPNAPAVTAYAGVRPHVEGIPGSNSLLDPGTVPVGTPRDEYVMTFSVRRRDLLRGDGKSATLSLRRPGEGADKLAFFNLRLDLAALRANRVPGVAFDDFVFEVTPADFGDAPDDPANANDYPTLLVRNAAGAITNDGARHLNGNLEWFGTLDAPHIDSVSPETNADDPADPDGVPNFDPTKGPLFVDLDRRDDGVNFFPLTYRPGAADGKVRFTVTVADAASGRYSSHADRSLYVNAWVDWNTNQTWEEANSEHILDGLRLNPANDFEIVRQPAGSTTVRRIALSPSENAATFEATFRVGTIEKKDLFSRFRLDYGENAGRNDPAPLFPRDTSLALTRGPARYGEVEDYPIEVDFGDAKDPFAGAKGRYPTRRDADAGKDGARHLDSTKEWIGATVTREFDACPEPAGQSPADQDDTPNLGADCKDENRDGGDEAAVSYDPSTRELTVAFTITSTISARGFDHPDDKPVETLTDAGGVPKVEGVAVPGVTPEGSRDKGRYKGGDEKKRLYVNIWADWDGDGTWDGAGEYLLIDGSVAPETFGKDGKYTPGDLFDDVNKNGVFDPPVDGFDPATHDIAGLDSRAYGLKFKPPEGKAVAEKFYVRLRLTYGEKVTGPVDLPAAHADEDPRRLDKTRGGALFGEVEDHPVGGSIHGQKYEDRNRNSRHDPGEPGLNHWTMLLFAPTDGHLQLIATQQTMDMDLNGDGLINRETESGLCWFPGLPQGEYVLAEAMPPGWAQTFPTLDTPGAAQLPPDLQLGPVGYLVHLRSGETVEGRDFGNVPHFTETAPGPDDPSPPPAAYFLGAPGVPGAPVRYDSSFPGPREGKPAAARPAAGVGEEGERPAGSARERLPARRLADAVMSGRKSVLTRELEELMTFLAWERGRVEPR